MKGRVTGLLAIKLILDGCYKQRFELTERLIALNQFPDDNRLDIVYSKIEQNTLNTVIEALEKQLYNNKIQ